MSDDTFSVNGGLMALALQMTEADAILAMLEWCAEFEFTQGRPATVTDFMEQKPLLHYRGLFEQEADAQP